MKKRRIVSSLIALALLFSLVVTAYAGTTYKAMIVQGNTKEPDDCAKFYNSLKGVSYLQGGNTYTIETRGWTYEEDGSFYHNYAVWPNLPVAQGTDLIAAKDYDVLYWSGHGGPASLNVHDPKVEEYGPGETWQPEINIKNTLDVGENGWASNCKWKNSRLKVAVFAACNVLDKSNCNFMARVMKASNVRVIAGYHATSHGNPIDTQIADTFFSRGVAVGESVRGSWQTANELNDSKGVWAVLCYRSNLNQYYGLPGFSGTGYSAPENDASIFRFWKDYSSPTGGQEIPTSLNDDVLPLEITVSNGNGRSVSPAGATVYREMNDGHQGSLNNEIQRSIAEDYLDEKYQSGIEWIGTVYCEEVNEEIGVVPGTQSEVGKTFCYSNQYSGIRLVNNFYKVATDATGVYLTIDRWKDVTGCSEATTGNTPILSADSIAVPCAWDESVEHTEMVYVPVSEVAYRLCHAVTLSDGSTYYVDAATGETVDLFVEDLSGR